MYYQKEIWSNIGVLYDKRFYRDFGSMLETSYRLFHGFIKMTIIARSGHFQ